MRSFSSILISCIIFSCNTQSFKGSGEKKPASLSSPLPSASPSVIGNLPAPDVTAAPATPLTKAFQCSYFASSNFAEAKIYTTPSAPQLTGTFQQQISGLKESVWLISSRETGDVRGQAGNGLWCLQSLVGEGNNEGEITTSNTGSFAQKIPLFCGKQRLELAWQNSASEYLVVTFLLDRVDCQGGGLRLTLNWGAGANDLELHLIKEGGRINNKDGKNFDCTWTSCIHHSLNWGDANSALDNPHKDLDWTGSSGIENIYLTQLEPTRYYVYVEYWASGSSASPKLTVNLAGTTQVASIASLIPKQVWFVGTVEHAGSNWTWQQKNETIDCTSKWQSGCLLALPAGN